jgi:hypothetical protein
MLAAMYFISYQTIAICGVGALIAVIGVVWLVTRGRD